MSYDSRLLGTLWIDPFPGPDDVPALREALAALAAPGAGRLVLSPLGHGLSLEDTFDWEAALAMIDRARATVFAPRRLVIGGALRAVGEDDAHLATIALDAEGVRVERHEEDDRSAAEAAPGDLDAASDKEAEWAQLRADVADEGLAAHADALVRLCVPSLRLLPRRRSKLKSRLGGLPDVPPGFAWPVASTGEPLTFVAQIDLAEVRAADLPGSEALPDRGMLSFFHGYEPGPDAEHCGNAGRVFFFDSPLSAASAPQNPSFTRLARIPVSWSLQTEELPPVESPFYAVLLADAGVLEGDPQTRAYEVFSSIVESYGQRGVRDDDERPVHRLLGYADPLQADVYLCTEGNASRVPTASWTTLEHHRAAARWRLLLQVDSDPAREVLFGDGGVLAFMIRDDDLAARRFDRVWVEWQSH
jgi:uncharacterized protein YwqG